MNIYLLILAAVILVDIRFLPEGEWNKDYISKEQTCAIQGIFVVLVFFTHFAQYPQLGGTYDDAYLILRNHMNQLVVVPFLFFSGYGLMTGIMRHGRDYVKGIMKKRFPQLLIRFDLILLLFLILQLALGNRLTLKKILLSLIGWDGLGNSNWYVFGIFSLYVLTFLSFILVIRQDNHTEVRVQAAGCLLLTLMTIGIVFIQMKMKRPYYSYNTLIMYPLGCWYAVLRKKLEKILFSSTLVFVFTKAAVVMIYGISYLKRWKWGIEGYTVWISSFMALILLISAKVRLGNAVLRWFGKHVFPVYILQRLPMIILGRTFIGGHKYLYFVFSFMLTLMMVAVYDQILAFHRRTTV